MVLLLVVTVRRFGLRYVICVCSHFGSRRLPGAVKQNLPSYSYLLVGSSCGKRCRYLLPLSPLPLRVSSMSQVIKIPEDIIQAWEVNGNTLEAIVEYLDVPPNVFDLLAEPTGITRASPASDVAFIDIEEWLAMVTSLQIDGNPLSLLAKSKLRHLYSACRVAAFSPDPSTQEADIEPAVAPPPTRGPPLAIVDDAATRSPPTPQTATAPTTTDDKQGADKEDKTKITIEEHGTDSSSSQEAAKKKKRRIINPKPLSMKCKWSTVSPQSKCAMWLYRAAEPKSS